MVRRVPKPKRGKPRRGPRSGVAPVARPTWDRRPNPARREELLARVSAHLLDKGLRDFSLRRAADAAGTSAQLLVHYFGTKDQLVGEALARIRAGWLVSVFQQDGMEQLEAFDVVFWRTWDGFMGEEYLRNLRLIYEVLSVAFREPGLYREVLDTVTVQWQTGFAASLVDVGVPQAAATRISTFYLAGMRGLLLDLLATGARDRIRDAAALLLENLQRDVMAALAPPIP